MKNIIIAISGKARSGKDSIATVIQDSMMRDGVPATKIAFAGPIKTFVHEVLVPHMPDEDYYDDEWREKDLADYNWPGWTLRKMWQTFGTESMRNVFGKDVWVRSMRNAIGSLPPVGVVVIIPDARFPNEQDYLREAFPDQFFSIRVDRDGADGEVGTGDHESESYVLDTDFIIENNGTLEELAGKATGVLYSILNENHEAYINGEIVFAEDEGSVQDQGDGGDVLP